MTYGSIWTIDQDSRLREMWNIEGRSASYCAGQLNVTRNAVIGRARRLGLERRASPIIRGGEPKPFVPKRSVRGRPPKIEPPRPQLADLGPCACRYPHGHLGADQFGFCAAPSRTGSPYCEAHHALCYTRAAPMQVPTPTRTGNPRHFGSEGKFINPRAGA